MPKKSEMTLDEALRGARLVLENGGALVEEAEILLSAGRVQRATALAILALEEFGKIPRILMPDRYLAEERMKDFWKYFRAHNVKAGLNALVTLGHDDDEPNWDDDWHGLIGSQLHELKMRALYVDFTKGRFSTPLELVNIEDDAVQTVQMALSSYEQHKKHLGAIDPLLIGTIRLESGNSCRQPCHILPFSMTTCRVERMNLQHDAFVTFSAV